MCIKRISRFSIILSALLYASSSIAGIYKWVDENGQVHYGERPVNSQSEEVHIRTNETTSAPDSFRMKTPEEKEAAEKAAAEAEQKKAAEEAAKPKVESYVPQYEKNRMCKEGKQDYQSISNRGRMREIDAKGNYRYLSDKERQQRLNKAKSKIRKYCR